MPANGHAVHVVVSTLDARQEAVRFATCFDQGCDELATGSYMAILNQGSLRFEQRQNSVNASRATRSAVVEVAVAVREGLDHLVNGVTRAGIKSRMLVQNGTRYLQVDLSKELGFRQLFLDGGQDWVATADTASAYTVDHLAVCVPSDRLTYAVDVYCDAFNWRVTHREVISVGAETMDSAVVQPYDSTFALTILSPARGLRHGQIYEFLAENGGPGVQHVALRADNIIPQIDQARNNGLEFLSPPPEYYPNLGNRVTLEHPLVTAIAQRGVLADSDHGGYLLQIFSERHNPLAPWFWELIERHGTNGFGSGNIRALYEAKMQADAHSRSSADERSYT